MEKSQGGETGQISIYWIPKAAAPTSYKFKGKDKTKVSRKNEISLTSM